jgi:hypothetical protein
LYSGSWQTQAEYLASSTVTPTASGVTGANVTTTTVATTGTTGTTGTSRTTGQQINFKVPLTKITRPVRDYELGSSSVLSLKPATELNFVKGGEYVGKDTLSVQSSLQSVNINIPALADSISGREKQGVDVQGVVNYYFTPGAPGASLFKGIKPSQFLTAALQIHPKLADGSFDPKYIKYCNILGFPVTDNPEASANKGKTK